MSVSCAFCHRALDDSEARFESCKSTVAHPDCLFEGYPDAEGHHWRFAASRDAVNPTLTGQRVYIARISHRHGNDVYVSVSSDGLDQQVYDYVAENWSDFIEADDESIPEDKTLAIGRYFEMAEDSEYYETDSYVIGA